MPRKRSWTDEQLRKAVIDSESYRSVLIKLNLVPAGGNYLQLKRVIKELSLDTSHFTGKGWNVGLKFQFNPPTPMKDILVEYSTMQSYNVKKRLFAAGIKKPQCELCGWAQKSIDGRIPVELDHINGNRYDNRIDNLRVLCPNCHSLQPTHRGRNKKVKLRAGVVIW